MTTVAVRTVVELLRFTPESLRTSLMFAALRGASGAAGVHMTETTTYRGASDLLLLWGPGAPDRFEAMRRQLAAGGHCISLDLAYWQRESKLRVSIDAAHPQHWVMKKDWPTSRFLADGVSVSNAWNPLGPIIVAGIGRKARVQYGHDTIEAWETEMMAVAADRFRRPVLYRRKQVDAPIPPQAVLTSDLPIEQILDGASLLITWHSNVAVDAIRMGIPVICRDGAAAAVCPSFLGPDDPEPLHPFIRARFLSNLAWFQWAPQEAAQCWAWLKELLA